MATQLSPQSTVSELLTAAGCKGTDPIDLLIDVHNDRVRVTVVTPDGRSAPRRGGDVQRDTKRPRTLPGWGSEPDVW